MQMLLDTKQTLDAEIALYRKMLEGEENRTGLRQLVEQVVKTHSLQQQEDTGEYVHIASHKHRHAWVILAADVAGASGACKYRCSDQCNTCVRV